MSTIRLMGAALLTLAAQGAFAASGEMGTGIPNFGIYSQATGTMLRVWSLGNPSIAFPSGCTAVILTPTTMGMDEYKIAYATLTTAHVAGLRVRLYAHAERDGGCGVDYVQFVD